MTKAIVAPVSESMRAAKERYKKFLGLSPDPDVVWYLSFVPLKCWTVSGSDDTASFVQPMSLVLQQKCKSSSIPPTFLGSLVSPEVGALPPVVEVKHLLVNTSLGLELCPGELWVSEACYAPALAQHFVGVEVGVKEDIVVPGEVLERLVKAEVEGKRARPADAQPSLRASSPALTPLHMAAFMEACNALTALHPWLNIPEQNTFRIRFPGGARPCEGYALPAGDTVWVRITGNTFFSDFMQFKRANPTGGNFSLSTPPHLLFNIRLYRQRSDAEAEVMHRAAMTLINNLRNGMAPRYPCDPRDLPMSAAPNPLDTHCAVCGKVGGVACRGCKEVSYCGGGAGCKASHAPAHTPVCVERKRKKLPMDQNPMIHMSSPVHFLHFMPRVDVNLEDVTFAERVGGGARGGAGAGGAGVPSAGNLVSLGESMGGIPIPPLFKGKEFPLPILHDGKGNATRPPLLELTRMTRTLFVLAAFLKDHERLASLPIPMEEEVPVVLPGHGGVGESWGEGVGGMGGMAWVRSDPLFPAIELPLRQKAVEEMRGRERELKGDLERRLSSVNNGEFRARVAAEYLKLSAAGGGAGGGGGRGGGGGGDHGHAH